MSPVLLWCLCRTYASRKFRSPEERGSDRLSTITDIVRRRLGVFVLLTIYFNFSSCERDLSRAPSVQCSCLYYPAPLGGTFVCSTILWFLWSPTAVFFTGLRTQHSRTTFGLVTTATRVKTTCYTLWGVLLPAWHFCRSRWYSWCVCFLQGYCSYCTRRSKHFVASSATSLRGLTRRTHSPSSWRTTLLQL